MNSKLAVAYGVKKQSKGRRMPVGEMTDKSEKSSMIESIRAKMMNKGGIVKKDEKEDFLSMDDGGEDIDWSEHDVPVEAGEIEGEGEARKAMLAKILSKRMRG